MKTVLKLVLFVLLMLIFPMPLLAADESNADQIGWAEQTMDEIDFSQLEEYKQNLDSELTNYLANKSVKEWIADFIQGKWEFNLKEICAGVFKYFFKEIAANSGILGKLLILSVVTALIHNLQASFPPV